MIMHSPRSLRRAYVEWVEEQIETYKDTIPRARLLALADEVVSDLRVNAAGQYQLTEMLLCSAVDRHVFRQLKLPGFRAWRARLDRDAAAPREPAARALLSARAEQGDAEEPAGAVAVS